jgi:hypothetical protein
MGSNQSSVSRRNRYPSKLRKGWHNLRIAGSPAVRGQRSEGRDQQTPESPKSEYPSGDNETTGPLTTRPQSSEKETLNRQRRTPNVELRRAGSGIVGRRVACRSMEWQAGALALQIGYRARNKPPRERRRWDVHLPVVKLTSTPMRAARLRSQHAGKIIRIRIVGGNKEEPGRVFIVKCFR